MDEPSDAGDPQDGPKVTDPSPPDALAVAGAAFADALGRVLRVAARRGRDELARAAAQGRVRFELRQLRRDRQRMFEKLGREVVNLVDGGEITHPGLVRGARRIQQLDEQVSAVEARILSEGGEPEGEDEQKKVDGSGGGL